MLPVTSNTNYSWTYQLAQNLITSSYKHIVLSKWFQDPSAHTMFVEIQNFVSNTREKKVQSTSISHSALNKNRTHTMFSTPHKNYLHLKSVGAAQPAPSHHCNSTAFQCWPLLPQRGINSSPSRLKCENLTHLHCPAKLHTRFADCTVYHRILSKYFYF